MANIDKINGISGFQGTDSSCGSVSLYGLRNFIDKVFVSSPNGTSYTVQTTSGANSPFAAVKNFDCGIGYIFFRAGAESTWSTFNIPNFEVGNLASTNKRCTTLFPESFTITGKGTFHLTSGADPSKVSPAWYSKMPVYKTANGSLSAWFDGSVYQISASVGNKSGAINNGSYLPNAHYGDAKSSSSMIEISGFTGSSAAANGQYAEVGYLNKQPLFRLAKDGKFYYFFNGSTWVLTDTPITVNGGACYINGGSSKTGTLDNSSGSNGNCFDGQKANVRDGAMDPRSLAIEDEKSLLSTEDKLNVMITEENL